MKIRHVSIRWFRGIKSLGWHVTSPTICLIGHGDSGKSTVLEAIDFALSGRWNLTVVDSDFYQGDTRQNIQIEVTVGELSPSLLSLDGMGDYLRRWSVEQGIVDEISDGNEDGFEEVITVRLVVDASLEPIWSVFTDRPDNPRISSTDRAKCGVVKLSSFVDRELSWGRGSALSRLTDGSENVLQILASAYREARHSVASNVGNLTSLNEAAQKATGAAAKFGVSPQNGDYQAALDTQAISGAGGLTLHDGEVPARMLGLGSKRLLTAALHREWMGDGVILLADEVEQGLEPHRLRYLLRTLRINSVTDSNSSQNGQVIMTTHSPVTVEELRPLELHIVRLKNGQQSIKQVSIDYKSSLENAPEAFLSKKIIVCEGKTEYGVCRYLDGFWAGQSGGLPFALLGVAPVLHRAGGGAATPKLSFELASLGYKVAFVCDSDTKFDKGYDEAKLQTNGVELVRWDGSVSIEERACSDLPWEGIKEFVMVAFNSPFIGIENVLNVMSGRLGLKPGILDDRVDDWLNHKTESEIRQALGSGSKKKSWFKTVDAGEMLGRTICKYLVQIPTSDLAKKLESLRSWVYAK